MYPIKRKCTQLKEIERNYSSAFFTKNSPTHKTRFSKMPKFVCYFHSFVQLLIASQHYVYRVNQFNSYIMLEVKN